jgi:hypothetical protein
VDDAFEHVVLVFNRSIPTKGGTYVTEVTLPAFHTHCNACQPDKLCPTGGAVGRRVRDQQQGQVLLHPKLSLAPGTPIDTIGFFGRL